MKKLSSIVLITMLMLSIAAVFTVSPVLALQPYVAINPENTVFMSPSVGTTFTLYVNISSTVGFVAYQFYLYWNHKYINATGYTKTPPASFTFEGGFGFDWDKNGTHGEFFNAWMDPALVTITGTYTIASITFEIIKVPKEPAPDQLIVINLDDPNTLMSDAAGNSIGAYVYDGDVFLKSQLIELPTVYVDTLQAANTTEYHASNLAEIFTVDIKVKDIEAAHDMWGWEYIMYYNTTLLDVIDDPVTTDKCEGVIEGPFLSSIATTFFISRGGSMFDPAYINTTYEQEGKIHAACLFIVNHTAPVGGGTLATITFNATYQTIAGVEPPASCWLDIEDKTWIASVEAWPGPDGDIPHNDKIGIYFAPVKSIGRDIDCYTDSYRKYMAPQYYTTFTGMDPQVNADAYQPQDLVILYALVTYGDDPVQNKPVQFEIIPPSPIEGFPLHRVAETDEDGIAKIEFRIPWPCTDASRVFGKWMCYQSVDIACEKVVDILWFEVAWTIWLKGCEVTPDPVHKCEYAGVTFWFENHALMPIYTYVTVVLYDHQLVPIGLYIWDGFIPAGKWCHPYTMTVTVYIHIPKWAFVGAPTVAPPWPYPAAFVNAYTFRCSDCGMPYCPEVSDTFTIAKA